MEIIGRVLNQDVYDLEKAVDENADVYLSVRTLNIGELKNFEDILVLRFGSNAYIVEFVSIEMFKNGKLTPDDKYWNSESSQYADAYEDGRFKKVKIIEKIEWSELGMNPGQALNELSDYAKKIVNKIVEKYRSN